MIFMENEESILQKAVQRLKRQTGLNVLLLTREMQWDHLPPLIPKTSFYNNLLDVLKTDARLSISESRTILQRFLFATWQGMNSLLGKLEETNQPIVWVLDDDKRLGLHTFTGLDKDQFHAFWPALAHQQIDVALGQDTGAAPLPALLSLRTQLVDICAELIRLKNATGFFLKEEAESQNRVIESIPDYYHDLSTTSFTHLELPMRFIPNNEARVNREEVLQELAKQLPRVCLGDQVTRKLVPNTRKLQLQESTERGGSTIVFQPESLLIPNLAPTFNGRFTRRSDMNWALLNKHKFLRRIVRLPKLVIHHDRSSIHPLHVLHPENVRQSVIDDVLGHAWTFAFRKLLESGRNALSRTDVKIFVDNFYSSLEERKTALTFNLFRIRGLIQVGRQYLESPDVWWKGHHGQSELRDLWVRLNETFGIHELCSGLTFFHRPIIPNPSQEEVVNNLEQAWEISSFKPEYPPLDACLDFFEFTRKELAFELTRILSNKDRKALSFAGIGLEGVTLHDSIRAWKNLDLWKLRNCDLTDLSEYSKKVSEAEDNTQGLLPLSIHLLGNRVVIERAYIKGSFYTGGRGSQIVSLLQSCSRVGIVLTNLSPNNLLCDSKGGLWMIDYGSDVKPWSEGLFHEASRRAYILWRWSHRHDLKTLQRKSLQLQSENELPELEGYHRFETAVNSSPKSIEQDILNLIVSTIQDIPSRKEERKSILDYGCGKLVKLIQPLLHHPEFKLDRYVGFDPDEKLKERNEDDIRKLLEARDSPLNIQFTTQWKDIELNESRFDLVLCIRVVCTLLDNQEYQRVLQNLRSKVHSNGKVLLGICHPLYCACDTAFQKREANEDPETIFRYNKIHKGTNRSRREFHRPLHVLKHDLLHAGLRIVGQKESRAIDLERFEEASDFLLLILQPVKELINPLPVTLLIKSSYMEWRTIRHRVLHLRKQLSGSEVPFSEVVLSVDCKRESFVRQHDKADVETFREEVSFLQRERWVDRVIFITEEREEQWRLLHRWLGSEIRAWKEPPNHTHNGSPLIAFFQAIESIRTPLVLQLDSDVMIGHRRTNKFSSEDYLRSTTRLFESEPAALTLSLNICQGYECLNYSFLDSEMRPWRVEVRAAFFHVERLKATRPWGCLQTNGLPIPWYRHLDALLQHPDFKLRSYRGGCCDPFFIHPPNTRKEPPEDYMLLLDAVERGFIPGSQSGKVDLIPSSLSDWMGPKRTEDFIFVVTGKRVPIGRIRRCLDSILKQQSEEEMRWGMVLLWDGLFSVESGDEQTVSFLTHYLSNPCWSSRTTLLFPRLRRGQLANIFTAVRMVCENPESVILSVDMDDALISNQVLKILHHHYSKGADLTVGSMLRTNKAVNPEYPVCFENCRRLRGGGNVWKHLKTFKKSLFDKVRDSDLRDSTGEYYDLATDWAFMIPMVERALHPVSIETPLYLYEASLRDSNHRERREGVISEIVQKPHYSKRKLSISVVGDASFDRSSTPMMAKTKEETAEELGQRLIDNGFRIITGGLGGVMEATCRGAKRSARYALGDTVGILPDSSGYNVSPFVDVVVPTGLGRVRGSIVALSDAIVMVGGGAGTIEEVAMAWSAKRLIVALKNENLEGYSCQIAGKRLDTRTRVPFPEDRVFEAKDVTKAIRLLKEQLPKYLSHYPKADIHIRANL